MNDIAKKITVIGSYNVGLFLKGQKLPQPGETVIGDKFYEGGGGKGSNQAVAASLLGADVYFIGKIGNDRYGQDALKMYERLGVRTDLIEVDNTIHSGISVIMIDKEGNNLISCIPGANYNLTIDDIDRHADHLKESSLVAFQLESPLEVVCYAIRKMHSMNVTTLLDPAPAVKLPEELFKYISIIKPNETEAEILTGINVDNAEDARKAGEWFLNKGVKNVIITLGKKGVFYISELKSKLFKTPVVDCIDSTGAGDIFSGALMSELSRGENIEDAIIFANCAAALSVTKLGVIESIPALDDVNDFLCNVREFL